MLSLSDTGVDAEKGPYIELSAESLGRFGSVDQLREIAKRRLADTKLPHRLTVIYKAILLSKRVYLFDANEGD